MLVRHLIVCALLCLAASTAHAQQADPSAAAFIERELAAAGVPGASVVLIRNRKIAWAQGFGVANMITRERVTPYTAFPAASNGKPIAAWLIIQFAANGVIDLRRPVLEQARVNLPDAAQHKSITPRHLLTHTSGLGNFLRDEQRGLAFEPGARFAYSGVGFMVLQELLEAKTRQPLDAHARSHLFVPLAMTRTWYGGRPSEAKHIAATHVDLVFALAPFAIAAAPPFALLLLAIVAAARWRTKSWRVRRWMVIAAAAATAVVVAVIFYRLSGSWALTLWFIAAPVLIAALLLLAGLAASRLASRDAARRSIAALVGLAAVAALAVLADPRLPLPTQSGEANAASSLYATAPDLARFLIELARPTLGDCAATERMTKAQHRIDAVAAWGLGIGVENHARGRDLWQWGSNPGAKSLMVISPETGDGVVILTNGEGGGALTRRIAAHLLGRDGCWRAGCANE